MIRSAALVMLLAFAISPLGASAAQGPALTSVLPVNSNGISEPFEFIVPKKTRSISIVVTGEKQVIYALSSLITADGVDQVGLGTQIAFLGQSMKEFYYGEEVSAMPGLLAQKPRLGTFVQNYPTRPGQLIAAGKLILCAASTATSGNVKIEVFINEEASSRVLHLNLISFSSRFQASRTSALLPELQRIFQQAGIQVVIDQAINLPNTGHSVISESTEPQENPDSQGSRIAGFAVTQVSNRALNVMIEDELPQGLNGFSLGVPGPPIPSSYYFGVFLRPSSFLPEMARVMAHEVSHFLGLAHVVGRGRSGRLFPDALDDTRSFENNLMDRGGGTVITPHQAYVLSLSPMLRSR